MRLICYCFHFPDEETEARGHEGTSPGVTQPMSGGARL